MTGDGVNDAPALKKAYIGIAVADATYATRSDSDIVLTELGLSVIISVVLTSRCIFQRMKNYTIYVVFITIRIVRSEVADIKERMTHSSSVCFKFDKHVSKFWMYEELWRVCVGPLVDVPRVDERVYYFSQGHMKQVEPDIDEVYAIITLLSELDQSEMKSHDVALPEPTRPVVDSFCKVLTESVTSTYGGFSVLRRHANECLPQMDTSQQISTQELSARDLHGFEWRFKHIFRGQPKRHLLTTGWSTFVTLKRLVAGDGFIFMRCL